MCVFSLLTVSTPLLPEVVRANIVPLVTQLIREVVLLEENDEGDEEEGEVEEEDDEAEEEDEGDDEDADDSPVSGVLDEASSGTDSGGRRAIAIQAARLEVPEDGYHEDEDCQDVEDESYRALLEAHEAKEKMKRLKFSMGEEFVDEDEEDDEEDDGFTSHLDNVDVGQVLSLSLSGLSRREPALYNGVIAALEEPDRVRLFSMLENSLGTGGGRP